MPDREMITTQRYKVGPYTFRSELPVVGFADDADKWVVSISGIDEPGRFDTLEAAMFAIALRALSQIAL